MSSNIKDAQQALHALAATANSFAGSGAGSGLSFGEVHGAVDIPQTLAINGGASAVLIPGSAASFPVSRYSQTFLVLATLNADLSGVIGSEKLSIYLDGVSLGIASSALIGSAPGAGTVGQVVACPFFAVLGHLTNGAHGRLAHRTAKHRRGGQRLFRSHRSIHAGRLD